MTEARTIWKDVVAIRKSEGGTIVFETTLAEKPNLHFLSIRAGLSWPAQNPGYFLLLGQRTTKNIRGYNLLQFLSEGEYANPRDLFDRLADECAKFHAEDVYVDLSENWRAFEKIFDNLMQDRDMGGLRLVDAPFREARFEVTLSLITRYVSDRALVIDGDTILADQLSRIPRGPLGDSPDLKWHAINALGLVLGGYEASGTSRMTAEEVRQLERRFYPQWYGGYRGPLD